MFCFQSPFDCEKHLSESFLSESVNNLHAVDFKSKILYHSDSNIPGSCTGSGSRKWENWKTKSHGLLFNKSGNEWNRGNVNERVHKRKSLEIAGLPGAESSPQHSDQTELPVETSHEKKIKFDGKDMSSLNYFQTQDIEFIDESKGSEENIEDDKNSPTGNSAVEIKNQKSENRCLNHKKSITNFKAINSSIENSFRSEVLKGIHRKDVPIESERLKATGSHGGSQVLLHLTSDFHVNCKSESGSDTNLLKAGNKSLKRQKTNSGTSLLSLCSLFSLSKSPTKRISRNNETKFQEQEPSIAFQQNLLTSSLSCCPLGSPESKFAPFELPETKHRMTNTVIVNKSPKPKNKTFFSDVHSPGNDGSLEYKSGSFFSSESSSVDASSDDIAPMASPEVISPTESLFSSPKLSDERSGVLPFHRHSRGDVKSNDSFCGSVSPSSLSMGYAITSTKLKLLHEGDAHVCYLSHTRTIFRKVLSSKLLRRWETHHIYFKDDCLCSKTPGGYLESPVPYSSVDEVYVVGRWDQGNRFCIRLVMQEGSLLLQTSNAIVRDQWVASILWKKNLHKYRNILETSMRPEVILKEIKALIYSSVNSPLQDDCIRTVPIDIISKVLNEDELWNDRQYTEEVIVTLAPLLEDSTPSPEMFRFFSRHCLSHPRSPVVADVFTSIVQRILKRTMDFGKSPLMRRFVADYFNALHSQNDGEEALRKFIGSVHGTNSGCPHPRVLPNLVAVNLAAVFSHFEQRKTLLTESANETNCNEALQLLDKQLECFVTLFLIISEYEDWRPGLAQLLQPIPFPDDALSNHAFVKEFIPVIRKIGTDPRCEVHEMVLGIRENKEGWLNVFCPSSLVCKDEGVLWCQMLNTLFYCCCRRKSFLQKMVKHLGALLLVALRGHAVAQEMLCLMLEWRLLSGEDQEMQVVTTLQSNESGRQKYGELCKRQEHLRELQKEGGPKKLTLPSRSTDADVARLLSCGSFGNLECLSLAFTHVTSACAHQLIQLPALRYLNLWATQFGDAGLVIIAEHLDKLQVLNLCETPVSDKGIAAIAAMRNLKKLNLNSTKLSPQTLDVLKLKLPTLQELDVRYTDAW